MSDTTPPHDSEDSPPAAERTTRLVADGGTESKPASRQKQLQQLFERVTDSAALVERQETAPARRCLDDDETDISEYVAESVRSDGLSDAISSPETDDGRG